MKRREAKYVHGSPRLSPEQIKTAQPVHETQARAFAKRSAAKAGKVRPPKV